MDWGVAAIWLGLAVLATLISLGLRLSVALTEILGVALLHALLKRPYPWPGVGFLLRGFAPLALSPV